MTDDINTALDNLDAIKNGDDPRTSAEDESTAATKTSDKAAVQEGDPLTVAEKEVNRLFMDKDIDQYIDRSKIHVAVARWERKNGLCKYDHRIKTKKHGKRLSGDGVTERGHHSIIINEKILEEGNRDGFIDTVRHELAHAVAHAKHGGSQGHNRKWKAKAAWLGADPSSTHHKKESEYNYYVGCPECGTEIGKYRICKTVKRPFSRMCGNCGASPLVSFDADDEMPDEKGTVAVEEIPWNDRQGWIRKS